MVWRRNSNFSNRALAEASRISNQGQVTEEIWLLVLKKQAINFWAKMKNRIFKYRNNFSSEFKNLGIFTPKPHSTVKTILVKFMCFSLLVTSESLFLTPAFIYSVVSCTFRCHTLDNVPWSTPRHAFHVSWMEKGVFSGNFMALLYLYARFYYLKSFLRTSC